MKACGRTNKATMQKCGTLFEGPGSYCRECRNEYQREHYKKRKGDHYIASTDKTGASCQACSTALRSNTVARVDEVGMEQSVVLCETCKAVVTYLSETVDESAQEFLVDLAITLADLKYGQQTVTAGGTTHTSNTRPVTPKYNPDVYVPVTLGPPTNNTHVEACGACEAPARPGLTFCERHKDYEEDYQNSYAAKMERGEL